MSDARNVVEAAVLRFLTADSRYAKTLVAFKAESGVQGDDDGNAIDLLAVLPRFSRPVQSSAPSQPFAYVFPETRPDVLDTLHASNILSLKYLDMPVQTLDTVTHEYSHSTVPCLISSGADKNVVVRLPFI